MNVFEAVKGHVSISVRRFLPRGLNTLRCCDKIALTIQMDWPGIKTEERT